MSGGQGYGGQSKSFQSQTPNFGGSMGNMQMSDPYSVSEPTPTQAPSGWPTGGYGPDQHQPGRTMNPMPGMPPAPPPVSFPGMGDPGVDANRPPRGFPSWLSQGYGPDLHQAGRTMNPMFSRFDPMGGVSFPGMGDPGVPSDRPPRGDPRGFDPMAGAQTGGQMTWNAPQIQQAQMSQPYQQQAPAPMNPYAQSQDAYNAAISGNNGTANAKPLWMQQGPIDGPEAQAKGIVLSEGPKAATPNTSNPGVTPLNLPPNGGVPPKPTGPMQTGQADWGWDNQRRQFIPSWTPQARQFILQNGYGAGRPAPWLTQGVRDAEWTDPNYLQTIGNLSGNRFGG